MKKIASLILLVSLLICSAALWSCEDGSGSFTEYTYADGKITSAEGDAYIPAPMGFQPCSVGDKCAVRDGVFDLYQVIDAGGNKVPTEEWMTEEYAGNATSVYYREGITLPAYYEIDYSVCYLCEEDVNVISLVTIKDREFIDSLIKTISGGSDKFNRLDDPVSSYTVKFHSDDFPALYYSIDYIVFEDCAYLYCIGTKQYAKVGTDLFDSYINLSGK